MDPDAEATISLATHEGKHKYLREVLLNLEGREEALQFSSPSPAPVGGASRGGGISPRRILPNRLPPPSSAGLNLLPFDQTSSVSAKPGSPEGAKLGRFLSRDGVSKPAGGMRGDGRLERHWSIESDTGTGGPGRSPGGPSNRRRETSREGASGNGPSRRHGLSNLASSSNPPPPPKPERSLAEKKEFNLSWVKGVVVYSRGSATLKRIVRPAILCGNVRDYTKTRKSTVPCHSGQEPLSDHLNPQTQCTRILWASRLDL